MHGRKLIWLHHIVKRSFSGDFGTRQGAAVFQPPTLLTPAVANRRSLFLLRHLGQGLQHGNDRPRRYAYDDGEEQDFSHIIALRFSAEELVTDVAEAGSKNGSGHLAGAGRGSRFAQRSVEGLAGVRKIRARSGRRAFCVETAGLS